MGLGLEGLIQHFSDPYPSKTVPHQKTHFKTRYTIQPLGDLLAISQDF